MAICGSCGMMVNGIPKLGCKTFLRDYLPGKMTIEPLNNFPIERDLVVDMSDFIEKLESIKPYIIPSEPRSLLRRRVRRRRLTWRSITSSPCASTAVCATRPARNMASTKKFTGPAAWHWPIATTPTTATARPESG